MFSEYHAHGTSRGMFVIREGRFEYVCHPDSPSTWTPFRRRWTTWLPIPDTGASARTSSARSGKFVDPDAIDRRAPEERKQRLVELSGDDG